MTLRLWKGKEDYLFVSTCSHQPRLSCGNSFKLHKSIVFLCFFFCFCFFLIKKSESQFLKLLVHVQTRQKETQQQRQHNTTLRHVLTRASGSRTVFILMCIFSPCTTGFYSADFSQYTHCCNVLHLKNSVWCKSSTWLHKTNSHIECNGSGYPIWKT